MNTRLLLSSWPFWSDLSYRSIPIQKRRQSDCNRTQATSQ